MEPINNFCNFVNNQLDTDVELFPQQPFLPSLKCLAATATNHAKIDLSRTSQEFQVLFLKQQKNFSDWAYAKQLCQLDTVSYFLASKMIKPKPSISESQDLRQLHVQLFRKLYDNSSLEIKYQIIAHKRNTESLSNRIIYLIQDIQTGGLDRFAKYISHPEIQKMITVNGAVISLAALLFTLKIVYNKTIHKIDMKIINFDEIVIKKINSKSLQTLNNFKELTASLLLKIRNILMCILALFTGCVTGSIQKFFWFQFPLRVQQMNALSTNLDTYCQNKNTDMLQIESDEAQNLWVNHSLAQYEKTRAKIEHFYASL